MTDYTVTELDLSNRKLTVLPDLFLYPNLQILHCSNNYLTSLDNLPPTLQELDCFNNQLTSLNNLPSQLQNLDCSHNQLTSLENFPPTLQTLYCHSNQLTSLKNLPPNLQELWCHSNQLTRLGFRNDRLESAFGTSLDILPLTLQELHCKKNPIYTICEKMYGFELSKKTIEQYNEIKRMEKECCPMQTNKQTNKMTDYTVTSLNLSKQNLTVLPDLSLYTKLKTLDCTDFS